MFYQVFVRSFADLNGDGVGDLRGLNDQLVLGLGPRGWAFVKLSRLLPAQGP